MPQRKSDANDPPVAASPESLARKADRRGAISAAGVGEGARGARAHPPVDDNVEGTGEEQLMDDGAT